jgi:hypothetical protein
VVTELAWTAPAEEEAYPERVRGPAEPGNPDARGAEPGGPGAAGDLAASRDPGAAGKCAPGPALFPFIADSRLHAMVDDLYDEVGAASFTVTWQHDPRGLLSAAVAFLADLRLLRPVPGGVLVLPAAARYRNIKLALPVRHAEGQLALDLFGGPGDSGGASDE